MTARGNDRGKQRATDLATREDRILPVGDRTYPIAAVICPVYADPDESTWNRALGTRGGKYPSYIIPCENGLLVEMQNEADDWHITLMARACYLARESSGERLWMPWPVHLVRGMLIPYLQVPGCRIPGTFYWTHATSEWACEHIDRLSRLPFSQPHGPLVELRDRSTVVE